MRRPATAGQPLRRLGGAGALGLERLREEPLVALRVAAAVASMAGGGDVGRLLDDLRALGPRPLMVRVDAVEQDEHQGRAADRGRVAETLRRLTDVDAPAAGDLELRVQPASAADRAVDLAEAEGAREELDPGLAVLVEQVWRYLLRQG